ncbi:putative T7SS-secreted protein [Streptomyces vietnamensis]|uniref:Type IV secretion protein Rhs n=1 Tax=Streptomyces vietnamensis TaxID=362257 RepID=A0A0B5I8S0_9ACTN|nr:RHS repeat-associated core domain-containing protein [Streptomyces vietnamensis]AJF66048.1 type IV secretion protein Rhs [Streptomyces vietnamensis]
MVDWGGWVDKGIDKIGDGIGAGIDKGKEFLGEGVDQATDMTGRILDAAGTHDWADAVEDWGDKTASSLGAEVGEQQLGQTEQADELVHGKPEKIAESVKNLRDFQRAFDLVGGGMKKLDAGHWKGAAADAFRSAFETLPTDWLQAADAMENAARALETYSHAIVSAQGKAREAIALYKEGDADSKAATETYEKKVAAYKAASSTDSPLPDPGDFSDPGTAKRKRAQEILNDARKARDEAAESAKAAVGAALAHAPKEPTGRERVKAELMDYGVGTSIELAHFSGGVVKGGAGLVDFVRSVNPTDVYNMTHPAEYYKGVNMTLAGLVSTVANPDRALKNAWDSAKGDPSEFLGRLLPELIGSKGTGLVRGGVRAAVKNGTKHLPEVKKPGGVRGDQGKDPHTAGKTGRETKCKKDPIDIATGRMLLPQTDIALPGSLPLVFRRTFDSSRRSGRWFGPTWSSTVDQRLEIDSEGVVFSCDEGSLLAYPHPAPGVPVMPTHGRQWPLDRVEDGYTITDPDSGTVRHFTDHSDELALLAQMDDRNGRWIAFEYDESGAPTAIVHHGGYHLKLTTSEGHVTALHLADQEILRYGYTDGHLTEVTNSSGRPLLFGCDEHGRITSWTDTNGSRFDYVYDDQDRCTYQSGTNGHLEATFTWDDVDPATGLRITTLTDGLGHTERHLINDRAQVVAEIDALGGVTRYAYDRHNRLLSRTDPLGHTARTTYDDQGRPTVLERPDGRQARAEYDEHGFPIRLTGTDGNVTRQTFDERGNRTSVTAPSGARTEFAYDESGRLTSMTDPLGATTRLVVDARGLPVEVTDPLGAVTRYSYDAFGRTVQVTDPLGAVTRLEWTVEGQPSKRTAPDGTVESWTYDGEGNCLSHTDALGGTTSFTYTDFDLLTSRTGPDGVRYEFAHDSNLRLTRVTNPQGLTWDYAYDAAGRLVEETDFDDRTLGYAYDESGRLTSRTNGLGQEISFERDSLGRIVRKDAEGAVSTYEYDVFDQLATATGPDATLARLRDRYGRLVSETVNGRTLSFEYDAVGRRTGRTTPGGSKSTWSYDAAGRRTELTSSGRTLSFTHDALGRETSRRIGDFANLSSSFDTMGRLTAQEVTGGSGRRLQHRAYTYRADGGLIGITDELSGARRFDLDQAGRVLAVHAHNWTERYAYDDAGNQTEASWPSTHPSHSSTGARAYTGTRITTAGSVRYEHDAQGRIVLRQKTRLSRKPDTWRYEWDAEDRLTSVTTPDGTVWRYGYDPLGRRISKQSPFETVHFTWDGATLCEQTTEDITLTWDHAGLRPLAQTERRTVPDSTDERFFAIVTDLVGTPTELVSESGDVAWRTRATLWGTTTWTRDATAYTPLRFPGQYFDPESGLHYNHFRYYDPESARYLSPDPLGLAPAPNPATYVHNPHTWSDPLGLAPDGCPPKGELSNPFEKRVDAERAAFEAAGVPYGESPLAEWTVVGDKNLKHVPGYIYSSDRAHWGHFRQFETENGSRVIVEHTHDPAGTHFHAGKPKKPSDRSFVNFGWDNQKVIRPDGTNGYPENMERYLKINKEGGDHHFFYNGE